MGENDTLRNAVERAIREAFERMRDETIARVMDALHEQAPAPALAGANSAQIANALRTIEAANTQSDILRALLEGCSALSQRCALFVVRGTTGVVWQAKGFTDDIRAQVIDAQSGVVADAVAARRAVSASANDLGLGNVRCVLVPLVIRDRVAALVYADAGNGDVDTAAIEILVRSAGYWIELSAARGVGATPSQTQTPAQPQPPTTPKPGTPQVMPQPVQAPPVVASPPPAPQVPTPSPAANEDDELHRKARRFAKLLVDEIKLYNAAKVTAGRLHGDLYDRLKDDIDKSRDAFNRRYGGTAAAEMDYFTQELVRGLADGNAALLGSYK